MEEEFLKSVNAHQGILFKVCRMYCSDNTDAEDLFQEILLQLWKAWPSFNSNSKISTYMYRVALNTAITRLRKNSRQPRFQQLSTADHAVPDSPVQRLDIVFDRELQAAIAELDKFDRALIMLYLDEKSYKEVAEIMNLTESNVGVKINRIKKKLKDSMNHGN